MATNDKYDRQLRLWGANGQRALMNAHILLVQADSVGTETLKNLVLPGVGAFTILDDFIVDHHDLGCNFFVHEQSLGRPRAEVVTELLCEMNSDVRGTARVANFRNVFQTEPQFFKQFSLIITANLPQHQLAPLAALCWTEGISLLVVKSFGFLGSVRLQLNGHNIVESKTEGDHFDLRIAEPFPELEQYCNGINMEEMDSLQHGHVPYIAILYKAIRSWRAEHDGKNPATFAEKEAFKAHIKAMSHDYHNEVNFQEAVREQYRAYARKEVAAGLQELLSAQREDEDGLARVLTPQNTDFDFLLRALDVFLTETGALPLSGAIPDLTATTEQYMLLQQAYQSKARADLDRFTATLHALLKEAGVPEQRVSQESVEDFCKHAHGIVRVTTRSIAQEVALPLPQEAAMETVREVLEDDLYQDPVQTPLLWYLALRAADLFYNKYARWPGAMDAALVGDQEEVFQLLRGLCLDQYLLDAALVEPAVPPTDSEGEMNTEEDETAAVEGADGVPPPNPVLVRRAHAQEIVRYGGCELHNISALIGGIASQEAVKVITHQFIPLNNTYIYNGIASCGATYAL